MLKSLVFGLWILLPGCLWAQDEADALLEEHFSATGQELWNELRDIAVDGRWVDENYYGHKMKLTFKAPNKTRIEGKYQKKTFIEAYDGSSGWIVAPWKRKYEVQPMSELELLIIRNSFSLGSPLYLLEDQLTYGGLKDKEGVVFHTFLYEDEQVKKTFYLDQENFQLYFEDITSKSAGFTFQKIYEVYKNYNGLSLPTAVRFEGENLDRELVFDQVYIGLGANDSMFEPPKGQ